MLLLCNHTFSQDYPFCITEDDYENPNYTYSNAIDQATIDSYEPVVYNVFYWQINDINGNTPDPLTEDEVLASVASLNQTFNTYNVFFKYLGLGELDSPDPSNYSASDCHGGTAPIDDHGFGWLQEGERYCLYEFVENPALFGVPNVEYLRPDAINIYVPYAIGFGGAGGGTGTNKLIIASSNLTTASLTHELGHNFGLGHTHSNYLAIYRPEYLPASCEHVTRDINDPVIPYNADVAGDDMTETAATPDLKTEYCYRNFGIDAACVEKYTSLPEHNFAYVNPETCTHVVGSVACDGRFFEVYEDDVRNFMAYSLKEECMDQFTNGQIVRMFETITDPDSYRLIGAETPLSSLYEPYKGEYYFAGPLPQQPPLFQPGFDYTFVHCGEDYPQPSDYDDTSFSYSLTNIIASYGAYGPYPTTEPYANLIHPNHSAIVIEQVNESYDIINVRRCYDNYNKAPKSGIVTRFNDNTLNANVTVMPKDSLQINNTSLIDDLPSGLYKIDKVYEDGDTEQLIIMKENN